MKTKIIKLVTIIIACLCVTQSANCQTDPNGLAVSAEASLLADTNAPQLFLTVHLLNTTSREMVVLTKKLDSDFDFEPADATKWTCTLGYHQPGVTYQGRLIVPPLNEFSPVTIKPKEEVIITHLIYDSILLKNTTKDTQITVCYAISPEWGSRFATWSGLAISKPFNVSINDTNAPQPVLPVRVASQEEESIFLNAAKTAFAKHDANALIAITCWDRVPDKLKDSGKQQYTRDVAQAATNITLINPDPQFPDIEWEDDAGIAYRSNLPVVKQLKITFAAGEFSDATYPVGEKDGKLYLLEPAPVKRQ